MPKDLDRMNDKQREEYRNSLHFEKPEVSIHKNGFEIRTDVLKYAKDFIQFNWDVKFQKFVNSAETDKDGKTTFKVEYPEIPTVNDVVEAAETFYNFVNCKKQ